MSVTIILPISRNTFLKEVFTAIELLQCDRNSTNLIAIVDGRTALYDEARRLVMGLKFKNVLCVPFSKKDAQINSIGNRRKKIALIHNTLKEHIPKCEYIFGIEDDTIVPKNAINELVYLLNDRRVGIVSGVEVGRHGIKYVGAWETDDVDLPSQLQTIVQKQHVIQEVDATGLYCFMVRKELYMNHTFKVFEANSFGPDLDYGLELRRQGYKHFVNWNVRCGHYTKNSVLLLPEDYSQIKYRKVKTTWTRI